MKIKVLFFQNVKWYMFYTKVIQLVSRKSYKLNKKDFIPNHIGFVIDNIYFESRLFGNWHCQTYDINFKSNILKSNIVKEFEIKINAVEKVALQYVKDNLRKKYSILKAIASFDCTKILGEKIGNLLNKLFDYLARNKKDYEFCIEYFIDMFLGIQKKKDKEAFINDYINFIVETNPFHPIIKYITKNGLNSLTDEYIAKETIPIDFYMYFVNRSYKCSDVVL